VRINQDAAQALHPEALDKTHPAHIGCQVIDLHRTFDSANSILFFTQVQAKALNAWHALVPARQGLFIDGADFSEALKVEITGERASDETACAANYNQIIFA
jgi:hypothetical protein